MAVQHAPRNRLLTTTALPSSAPLISIALARLQCKACKTGEYASPATNNCCTKCKGNLTFAGDVPTCTPRPKGRHNSTDDNPKGRGNSTDDNPKGNSSSITTCPDPFLTITDAATGAKSCREYPLSVPTSLSLPL